MGGFPSIFCLKKASVRAIESHSYFTGATTDKLQQHQGPLLPTGINFNPNMHK